MKGWFAVYLREMLILRRKIKRQIASMAVSPVLYLLAFGFGIGENVSIEGRSYLEFLLPGLVSMGGMIQAFAIGSEINIARFYWGIFEEIQSSPVGDLAYVTGEALSGITRALASTFIVMAIAALSGVFFSYGLFFWCGVLLNALFFSSIAIGLAMVVRSHADQALLSNFIITPMAFLGGTFFPTGHMPGWVQGILSVLPLTHASRVIRDAAFGGRPPLLSLLLLAVLGSAAFGFAVAMVKRARD